MWKLILELYILLLYVCIVLIISYKFHKRKSLREGICCASLFTWLKPVWLFREFSSDVTSSIKLAGNNHYHVEDSGFICSPCAQWHHCVYL